MREKTSNEVLEWEEFGLGEASTMNWDQLLIPLFQIIHKSRRDSDETGNARISSAVIKHCMLKQHQRFTSSWAGLNQKWWWGTCNSLWERIKLNHAQQQVYNDFRQNHMLCMTIQRPAHKHTTILGGGAFLLVWFIWWNFNLKYWSLSTILTLSWFWATQMTLITMYPLCHEVCQPLLFPSHDCLKLSNLEAPAQKGCLAGHIYYAFARIPSCCGIAVVRVIFQLVWIERSSGHGGILHIFVTWKLVPFVAKAARACSVEPIGRFMKNILLPTTKSTHFSLVSATLSCCPSSTKPTPLVQTAVRMTISHFWP